jgi:phage tail sheath protein FI
VNIFIDSDKDEVVKTYMSTLCENRMDCMAVLDSPFTLCVNNSGNEANELREWRQGVGAFSGDEDNLNQNTSYAALYANWLEVFDKWNNKFVWIPSSGHVAGIFARTDDVSDPWFAPAGFQRAVLSNVRRLGWNPTLGDRDILYKNGLNPLVSFAGQGKVVFGQKTMLYKNSAFNRINVRRLFIILEKAISTAVVNFLFEPNDELSRLLLVNMIDPFLRDVRARRGIFDFLVICDETNNTPERVDRNELWCDIYVKPTRAAEFIVLNFIATKTGASFTEIAALRAGRA